MPIIKWLFIFLLSTSARATEIIENYYDVRAMGMGNAYTGMVSDHTSLFINPAGIDRVQGMHITALNLQLGTDVLDVATFQNALNGNYLTLIQALYGRAAWVGLTDQLAFSMKGFAASAFNFFNMSLDVHNPAYPNINLSATNDYGLAAGGALAIIPKIWRMGLAVKRITRYGGRVPLGPGTVATMSNAYISSLINNFGTGYGLDAGMLLTIPAGVYPTLSLVWHDIGQTKFNSISGSIAPLALDNEAVVGLSAYIDAKALTIKPALDFKHVFQVDYSLAQRIHMGIEFEFPGFAARGGFNQGYWTAGLSLNLSFLKVDLASYGVEMGSYPGQTEDRRYMLNLTMDFSIKSPLGGNEDEMHGGGSGSGKGSGSGSRRWQNFQRR